MFPLAIPLVHLDITFSREAALTKAQVLATTQPLAPEGARAAAVFDHDDGAQNYIELEGGGKEAFARLVDGGLYAPYWWDVRLFLPGAIDEASVRFRPDGALDGFSRRLAETHVRDPATKALTADAALTLARAAATTTWGVNLTPYRQIETATQTRTTGRVDHRFVFERDEAFGEGRIRLQLAVAGDELVEVAPSFFVPESFDRRFAERRSTNNSIAAVASIAAGVLYGLVGCILGALWLLRSRMLLVRPALAAGFVVGLLLGAASLANYPAAWFAFSTTSEADMFWVREIGKALATVIGAGLALGLVFMAAEGLTRRAFPHQPQLWQLWSRDAGGSVPVAGRTAGGYLFVPIELALVALFYYATNRWLGWWQPSEALTDPNILSAAVPALMPIAMSLQAGFMEECLFRAIPLALGALVGAHFGHRRVGIAIAFVLQAAVFGAAHANYPGFPAYSRLVELILPSMLWALIFLRYGLLPTILLHTLFDLVLFSIPLFLIVAPAAKVQQLLVIGAALIPAGIVIARRVQQGAWAALPARLWNGAWQPRVVAANVDVTPPPITVAGESPTLRRALPVLGLLGLAAWLAFTPWRADAPALAIDRAAALTAAESALRTRGVVLDAQWQRMALPRHVLAEPSARVAHTFVWRKAGADMYHTLIGNTLAPPLWEVRFARFDGDVAERAEEWRVSVTGDGAIRQIVHRLPEARAGASLEQPAALLVAQRAIQDAFGIDPAALVFRSADATQQPARRDWVIAFADPRINLPDGGEARVQITLAGDEVIGAGRYVFVPEAWQRREAEKSGEHEVLAMAASAVIALTTLAALIFAVVAWNRGQCDRRALMTVGVITLIGLIGTGLFGLPALYMQLQNIEPIGTQVALALLGGLAGRVAAALLIGLLAGVGVFHARQLDAAGGGRKLSPWIAGGAAALALRGFVAAIEALAPATTPLWPEQGAWALAWPGGALVGTASAFVITVTVGLFVLALFARITAHWTRRVPLAMAIVVLLTTASALSAVRELGPALATGLLGGVTTFALIALVLRHDGRAMPVFVATGLVLAGAQGAVLTAQPLAWVLFAASALMLGGLTWAAIRYLHRAPIAIPQDNGAGP
ncbi:MAG: CPBP family intramembrane glutamic endopeptidase [Betaproteobacteria bacterium]